MYVTKLKCVKCGAEYQYKSGRVYSHHCPQENCDQFMDVADPRVMAQLYEPETGRCIVHFIDTDKVDWTREGF